MQSALNKHLSAREDLTIMGCRSEALESCHSWSPEQDFPCDPGQWPPHLASASSSLPGAEAAARVTQGGPRCPRGRAPLSRPHACCRSLPGGDQGEGGEARPSVRLQEGPGPAWGVRLSQAPGNRAGG